MKSTVQTEQAEGFLAGRVTKVAMDYHIYPWDSSCYYWFYGFFYFHSL